MTTPGVIFVTVGTDPQPFDRLLREVDALQKKGFFRHPVFCQTGYSKFIPDGIPSKPFLSFQEFEEKIASAELIITHGGAGSIGSALQHGKNCVVVPRLFRFGEHANDHQLELTDALEQEGRVIAVREEKQLEAAIQKAFRMAQKPFSSERRVTHLIEEFIREKVIKGE